MPRAPMHATPAARHRRNCLAGFFIVSIPAETVPELGTTATLPLSPNHGAFIVPFLGGSRPSLSGWPYNTPPCWDHRRQTTLGGWRLGGRLGRLLFVTLNSAQLRDIVVDFVE